MKEKYINSYVAWPLFEFGRSQTENRVTLACGDKHGTDVMSSTEEDSKSIIKYVNKYHDLICEINSIDEDIVFNAIEALKRKEKTG